MDSENKIRQTPLTVIAGGAELLVRRIDGGEETVRVRQLPLRLLPAYGDAVQDENKLAELVCDRPEGWAETLTPDSLLDVVEAADELNRGPFFRWAERRLRTNRGLAPLMRNLPASARPAPASASGADTPQPS